MALNESKGKQDIFTIVSKNNERLEGQFITLYDDEFRDCENPSKVAASGVKIHRGLERLWVSCGVASYLLSDRRFHRDESFRF